MVEVFARLKQICILLTVRPYPRCRTNNLPDILVVVDNRANAQTRDCEGRSIPRGVWIGLRKRIDIFRVLDSHLELAPRNLRKA
jgi:hypothetical protein